jgi:hypothetical protein
MQDCRAIYDCDDDDDDDDQKDKETIFLIWDKA